MFRQAIKPNTHRNVMLVSSRKRSYNTLIERQSEMHLVGMDTTSALNLIETLHVEYGLSMPQSLIFIQACCRLI